MALNMEQFLVATKPADYCSTSIQGSIIMKYQLFIKEIL